MLISSTLNLPSYWEKHRINSSAWNPHKLLPPTVLFKHLLVLFFPPASWWGLWAERTSTKRESIMPHVSIQGRAQFQGPMTGFLWWELFLVDRNRIWDFIKERTRKCLLSSNLSQHKEQDKHHQEDNKKNDNCTPLSPICKEIILVSPLLPKRQVLV